MILAYTIRGLSQKCLASLGNFGYILGLNLSPQLKRTFIYILINTDNVLIKRKREALKANVEESCDVEFFRCMITHHAHHTSAVAMAATTECGDESLTHPPYLLGLASSDFCLFPSHSAFDNDECHVMVFRPISEAAHSWSYNSIQMMHGSESDIQT